MPSRFYSVFALTLLLCLFCLPVSAQVIITPNPSLASPQTGTSLPATCTVGALYFKSDATAGQNLYECTATNTWTQQLNSGAAGAATALDNLASVSLNTTLLAQTGVDLGSAAKPFRELFLFGSGSYGTNYFRFVGTPTGARQITLPDAAATLLYSGGPGGTPASLTGTNISGTAASLTAGQSTAALGIKSASTTVACSAATAPSAGQVLTATSSTACDWETPGVGTGDVTGQSSSVDGEMAVFSGTGGKTIARFTGTGVVTATSGVPVVTSVVDPSNLPTDLTYTSITGTTSIATCGGTYLATGTSADYAITLPAASGHTGCAIYLKMGKPASLTKLVTVTRAGSDLIEQPSGATAAATLVMWAGETCGFISDGVSHWYLASCRQVAMRAIMQRQTTQAIPDNTETKVDLATAVLNIGSMADAATNHYVTIRRAGTYMVHACWYASSGTGLARVVKNGSTEILSSTGLAISSVGFPIVLAAGDTVQLNLLQVSGGSLDTYTSTEACIAPSLSVFEEIF